MSIKYSESSVTIDKPTIINGNVSFNTFKFNGKGYIVADKNISFNVSSFNKDQKEKLILSSGNGDITINCSKIDFNGIIYAPNGTVSTIVNHFSTYFVIDAEDYFYDINILNSNSKIDTGKADIVFAIDTTGSMAGPIDNVKNNINTMVDKLKADKVDVRFGWFTNVDDFKAAVNSLYASGGGDWEESAVDGLEVARKKDFRSSVTKYITLITNWL